ncbi:MAG: FAD-binding protein [Verrucomicrobiaceae bacterium]|nr:FAD-binding protein [Verrucomicrobiaceae bacterium]
MTFLSRLASLIPHARMIAGGAGLAAYQSDGLTAFAVRPRAVVLPDTADEVIDVVRLCHEHGVPFVARGSGTSLSGGSVPVEDGIVIGLNRMDRILRLDPDSRIAVVEPGVTNLAVTKAAAPHGLHYAPDPSSQQVCTIGGNVAFNSGGAHCLKYGMTTNHVLGLKVVLADGSVHELGGASLESSGPDLTGLFCGSEGLFGIALEITLRLLPKAACFHTVLAGYDTLQKAGDTVAAVVASGLLPGAMEIMDRLAMDAAEAAVSAEFPPGSEACLIVELEGTPEQVAAERPALQKILDCSGAIQIRIARDAVDRMRIWKGRKSAFSAVGRLSPDFIVQDGVVPRRALGEALRRIGESSKRHGLRVANVFHAGDGNLHPLILYDGRIAGELEKAEELAGEILVMCIEMGGSITGEHGVGLEKKAFLPRMFGADDIEAMQRVRRLFDPKEIANPGKMFPGGDAPAMQWRGLHPLEAAGVISRE